MVILDCLPLCVLVLGPCGVNEVFYTYPLSSPKGIASCFLIVPHAQVTFEEVEDACLDSSGLGSNKYAFNQKGPEYDLLMGTLNYQIHLNSNVK